MKSTYFDDDSNDGIKKEIETLFPCLKTREWRFFRCTSTSDLGLVQEPNVGCSIGWLRR